MKHFKVTTNGGDNNIVQASTISEASNRACSEHGTNNVDGVKPASPEDIKGFHRQNVKADG